MYDDIVTITLQHNFEHYVLILKMKQKKKKYKSYSAVFKDYMHHEADEGSRMDRPNICTKMKTIVYIYIYIYIYRERERGREREMGGGENTH